MKNLEIRGSDIFCLMIFKFFFVNDMHDSCSLTKSLDWIAVFEGDVAKLLVSSSFGRKKEPIKAMREMNPQKIYEWKFV